MSTVKVPSIRLILTLPHMGQGQRKEMIAEG